MKTYLLAGIDPIGEADSKPKVIAFVRHKGGIEAVDVASKEEREKYFFEAAEQLYQEHFRFCAVWQDGWTWEQFCAEQKRLDAEKAAYLASKT